VSQQQQQQKKEERKAYILQMTERGALGDHDDEMHVGERTNRLPGKTGGLMARDLI
jgi:hypothetical protein